MIIQKTGDDLGAAEKGLFRTEDIMCSGSRHGPLPGGFGAGVILGPMQVESEPNGLCGRQRRGTLMWTWVWHLVGMWVTTISWAEPRCSLSRLT